jgi:hypothetical protein
MYLLHEKEHYPFASYQERYLGQILEKWEWTIKPN